MGLADELSSTIFSACLKGVQSQYLPWLRQLRFRQAGGQEKTARKLLPSAPPWAPLMAGTFLAALPIIVLFMLMARRMVDAIGFSGIK